MKHPKTIEKYDGDLFELACDISNLRYDVLADLLMKISMKIHDDALKDMLNKRPQLSRKLYEIAGEIYNVEEKVEDAWKICEPYKDK